MAQNLNHHSSVLSSAAVAAGQLLFLQMTMCKYIFVKNTFKNGAKARAKSKESAFLPDENWI